MATIADLVIKVLADTAPAEKDIKSFGSSVKAGFGKALLPAVGVLGGVAVGAKKVVDQASDMNETVSKTHTVFGKSGDDVEKWGESLAKNFGISKREGLDAASTFGVFGKAAGKTGQDLVKFSEPLVQAAADLGSFHNVPVAQALEDIRSGLAGETEPLRKYGILLNDAALRQKALQMGLVSTTKDALSPQNKMLASQQLILEKLGPAAGDFARTSSSAANQSKIQAAETANLNAKLGSGLLPIYQMGQQVLLAFTGVLAAHTDAVKIGIGVIAALAAGVVIVNAATAAWTAAQTVARVATAAWTAAQWLLNAALTANPIGIVIVAVAALTAAVILAYRKSETFRDIVNGVFGFMRDNWKPILIGFTAAIAAIPLALIAAWQHSETFRNVVKGALNAAKAAFDGVSDAAGAVKRGVEWLKDNGGTAVTAFKNAAMAPLNAVKGVLSAIASVISAIKSGVQWLIDNIGRIKAPKINLPNLPDIPGFASGVRNFGGGLAVVGEHGPELVGLPRGSDVYTNSQSRRMLNGRGGGGPMVNIEGDLVIREEIDVDRAAAKIGRRLAVVQ